MEYFQTLLGIGWTLVIIANIFLPSLVLFHINHIITHAIAAYMIKYGNLKLPICIAPDANSLNPLSRPAIG